MKKKKKIITLVLYMNQFKCSFKVMHFCYRRSTGPVTWNQTWGIKLLTNIVVLYLNNLHRSFLDNTYTILANIDFSLYMFELLGTKLMTFDFPIYLLGCYFVWLLDFEVSRMVTDAWVWLLLTGTPQKFGYQDRKSVV